MGKIHGLSNFLSKQRLYPFLPLSLLPLRKNCNASELQSMFCLKMMPVLKLTSVFLVVIIIDSFWSISLRHCRDGSYVPVIEHSMVSSSKFSPISKVYHEFELTKHMPKMNP